VPAVSRRASKTKSAGVGGSEASSLGLRRGCLYRWIDADDREDDANGGQDGEDGKKFCYMLNGQRWRPGTQFTPRLRLPQEVKEYMAEPAQQHYGIVVIRPGQLDFNPGVYCGLLSSPYSRSWCSCGN
jgi:hypothetical protein